MKLTNKDQQITLIQQRRLTTQITHTFHKPTNAEQRLRSSPNQTQTNKLTTKIRLSDQRDSTSTDPTPFGAHKL